MTFLNNQTPPHILTLSLAAAVSPLAMNVYLPSLAEITNYFNTDTATTQLSVSLFLAATAAMQLVCGPLSDKFGRRPVMLGLFAIMLVATLLCIYATTIEMFLFARVMQASAAVGIVLSRAIARDIIGGAQAASMIGYVTMGMTLAPMLGPPIGGLLAESFGWQASFWLIFGFTVFVMIVSWFDLGETNRHKGASMSDTFKAWPDIIRSHRFWGYSLCCAFSSGAFFAFLGGGPLIAIQYYGLGPSETGLYFLFVAIGYMLGNYIAGRFSVVTGLNSMMLMGNIIVVVGIAAGIALVLFLAKNPFTFFGAIFFLGLGNGMTLPNANAGIVNVRPQNAGAASGLGGSMQIGGGALLAAFTGYVLIPEEGPILMLIIMIATIIAAILSALYVMHIDKLRSIEGTTH
ncbi:MAG: multidrug effflux MFS transporter [Pseudomonadota bacterium]